MCRAQFNIRLDTQRKRQDLRNAGERQKLKRLPKAPEADRRWFKVRWLVPRIFFICLPRVGMSMPEKDKSHLKIHHVYFRSKVFTLQLQNIRACTHKNIYNKVKMNLQNNQTSIIKIFFRSFAILKPKVGQKSILLRWLNLCSRMWTDWPFVASLWAFLSATVTCQTLSLLTVGGMLLMNLISQWDTWHLSCILTAHHLSASHLFGQRAKS